MLKIKGSKILAAICAAAIALSMTSCGDSSDDSAKGSSDKTQSTAESTENNKDFGEQHFWIESVGTSSAPKDSFNAELFEKGLTLPITTEKVKELGMNWYKGRDGEDFNYLLANSLGDLKPGTMGNDYYSIYDHSNTTDNHKFSPKLVMNNFGDEDISAADALDNGWWYLNTNEYTADDAIMVNDFGEYDKDSDNTEFFNKMIEQIGEPTEISQGAVGGHKDFQPDKNGFDMIYYTLVYECKDYVVTIFVDESIMVYSSDHVNHALNLMGCEYYPIECWNKLKENNPNYPNEAEN
ncbi:MAG: hypothetical protein ACI4RN_02940 [Oscillospiraceae bacterium]